MGNASELEIIGNRALLGKLERDIRDGMLSHAYILDGRPGSGRHTVARWVCAALACHHRPGRETAAVNHDQLGFFDALEPVPPPPPAIDATLPCGDCPACRKVIENKCPDIRLIGREGKTSIGVDAVRFLRQDVLIAPNDLDTKIYIIEDAETMTVQAQNALLLTLEEPPPYVLFLLLCNGADALLETIRSRAPVLTLEPVPDENIRTYLRSRKCTMPEHDLDAVLLCADGCIGQALALSDAKSLKGILKRRAVTDAYMEGCATRSADRVLAAIGQFGNKRDTVTDILDSVILALRDLLLLKAGDAVRLKYYIDRDAALELAGRMTTRSLLGLYDATTRARDGLERNGNIRLTLIGMCLEAGLL